MTKSTSIQTSIIIPAYNEEAGLPVVLKKLYTIIDNSYEVIIVDDGSIDKTGQIASQFSCKVITHQTNLGKGEAMKTGISNARGKNIIFIDADDTYPVEVIPDIVKGLENFDMVVGSRIIGQENIPVFNRLGNALFRILIKSLSGYKPRDPLTGLYGIKKDYLDKTRFDSTGFSIETEIAFKAARMKLRILDLPIEYRPRIGKAKLNRMRDGKKILGTIFREWLKYK
jgi:glycosyltransferase involved in cell wall biosynthesis